MRGVPEGVPVEVPVGMDLEGTALGHVGGCQALPAAAGAETLHLLCICRSPSADSSSHRGSRAGGHCAASTARRCRPCFSSDPEPRGSSHRNRF